MSAQPRNGVVARARYRILTGRSPATPVPTTAAAVNASRAGTSDTPHQPGGSPRMPAQNPGAGDWRDDVIIGHWLANGRVSVHAPGQPCALCACPQATSLTRGSTVGGKPGEARSSE